MTEPFATASLLPLLMPGTSPLRLHISLPSGHSTPYVRNEFPFMPIGRCGPFAQLVAARLVSGAENTLLPLFLMKQTDRYELNQNDIWPLNNPEVDRLWQQAFERYRSSAGETDSRAMLIHLLGPERPDQPLQQLLSLFYCGVKHVYFHPPCPSCGKPLQLCRDDRLLQDNGLQPYSRTLVRYLYCPTCSAEKPATDDFYIDTLPDTGLPVPAKDRSALIGAFANLILKPDAAVAFPCLDCPENTHCYGPETEALKRIVPFSFYPFYLLCFRAPQLHAIDFLALVSGAACPEIIQDRGAAYAPGRIQTLQSVGQMLETRPALLFGRDHPKHFLETLYLKLSFLGEVSRHWLRAIREHQFRDFPLSLDTIWINLPGRAELLPRLWNFDLTFMDIGYPSAKEGQLGHFPPAYGMHVLGTLWFYTLLVNRAQSADRVYEALFSRASNRRGHAAVRELSAADKADQPVFSPRNLFWQPREVELNPKWQKLWDQALDLGHALMRLDVETADAFDDFRQRFILLRDSIHEALFGTAASLPTQPAAAADKNIPSILAALKDRWQTELKETEQRHPPTTATEVPPAPSTADRSDGDRVDQDVETAETVIMSPEALAELQGRQPPEKKEDETLILSAEDRKRLLASLGGSKDEPDQDEEEISQETVILSSGPSTPESGEDAPSDTDRSEEDLPETVILSPGQQPPFDTAKTGNGQSDHPNHTKTEPPADSSVEDRTGGGRTAGSDDADEADDLPETLIIRPGTEKKKD